MPTLEELTGMLSDVTARLLRVENRAAPTVNADAPAPTGGSVAPFWDLTLCSGLTLTTGAGADWSTQFDVTTTTLWRKVQLATKAGEFDFGALGIGPQRRLAITWDAVAAGTVKCLLCGFYTEATDTDGYVQVKMNGVVTEYDTTHGTSDGEDISLPVVKGRNALFITTDARPSTLQFYAVLFDETRGDKFVDPRTESGYLRSTT